MDLPDNWGTADFEIISVSNLGNSAKPTVVELKMVGFIRGIDYEMLTTFVCSPDITTYNELSEEITYNCLYPWVIGLISQQDAEVIK
jgi:hypothetical protein